MGVVDQANGSPASVGSTIEHEEGSRRCRKTVVCSGG